MSLTSRQRFWRDLAALGFSNYPDYLASEHWADLRRRYFASKLWHGKCSGCGTKQGPFQLHHRMYRRIGHEWLMDVVGVCRPCHEAIHRAEGRWNLLKTTNRVLRRRKVA